MRYAALLLLVPLCSGASTPEDIRLDNDGGWCWFEDERAIVTGGQLIVGAISGGIHDPARKGDVTVLSLNLQTRAVTRFTLHHSSDPALQRRWFDDHNSPALLARPDGRILALYSLHGSDEQIHYRITTRPGDIRDWTPEQVYIPTPSSRATYSNLHYLARENAPTGRIYDFFRGLDNSFKPSYAWSDDLGASWTTGSIFIRVPLQFRHRPYVKYASNGQDTVHIAYTDGHPRDFDNSIYHVYYRAGRLHHSDGTPIRALAAGLNSPDEGTRVFPGDANNVAWISDLHLDSEGHPYLAYSVQKDSAGKPPRDHGSDHRYRYARYDGRRWHDSEIAYAGGKLYPGEDDYTGNIALDPQDPSAAVISTNADPATGKPLPHWELYLGRTRNSGRTWRWTALTSNSAEDNIRPIIPIWPSGKDRIILWARGKMRSYTDYTLAPTVRITPR